MLVSPGGSQGQFLSALTPAELSKALAPEGWLGAPTRSPFGDLDRLAVEPTGTETSAHFAARGLGATDLEHCDAGLARLLISLDVRSIAHALSLMLSGKAQEIAIRQLPALVLEALEDDLPQLDHIGIEIFGKLDWYLETLATWEDRGLLRLDGYRVFPSVQVSNALSSGSEAVKVRIARVFIETGEKTLNLELFETSQHWHFTAMRQLMLYAAQEHGAGFPVTSETIAHLAFEVESCRTVDRAHQAISAVSGQEGAPQPYREALSYNPGDQSLNCKFVTGGKESGEAPASGRLIEIVSYGVEADPRTKSSPRRRMIC